MTRTVPGKCSAGRNVSPSVGQLKVRPLQRSVFESTVGFKQLALHAHTPTIDVVNPKVQMGRLVETVGRPIRTHRIFAFKANRCDLCARDVQDLGQNRELLIPEPVLE